MPAFYKIIQNWLSKKAVPVTGQAIQKIGGELKKQAIVGTIDFTGETPILSANTGEEVIRYPVAISKVKEDSIYCVFFDVDDPTNYTVFNLQIQK